MSGGGARGGGEVMEWMKSFISHFTLAFHLHALSSSALIILFVCVSIHGETVCKMWTLHQQHGGQTETAQ